MLDREPIERARDEAALGLPCFHAGNGALAYAKLVGEARLRPIERGSKGGDSDHGRDCMHNA